MDVQACPLGSGMAGAARRANPTYGDRTRSVAGGPHCVGRSSRRALVVNPRTGEKHLPDETGSGAKERGIGVPGRRVIVRCGHVPSPSGRGRSIRAEPHSPRRAKRSQSDFVAAAAQGHAHEWERILGEPLVLLLRRRPGAYRADPKPHRKPLLADQSRLQRSADFECGVNGIQLGRARGERALAAAAHGKTRNIRPPQR